MSSQVITIGLGGEISGLHRKKGQGVNLQEFGHAKTDRVSEIQWCENAQAWYVLPIQGPFKGQRLTRRLWEYHAGHVAPEGLADGFYEGPSQDHTFYFTYYEDAVKAEITFLDKARVSGLF